MLRQLFPRREVAAQNGPHAKHGEQIAADAIGNDPLRFAASGKFVGPDPKPGDAGKDVVYFSDGSDVGR